MTTYILHVGQLVYQLAPPTTAPAKGAGAGTTSIVAAIVSGVALVAVAIIGLVGKWYVDRRIEREKSAQSAEHARDLETLRSEHTKEIELLRSDLRERELRFASRISLEQQRSEDAQRSLVPLVSAVGRAASDAFEACKAVIASGRRGEPLSSQDESFEGNRVRWNILYRICFFLGLAGLIESRNGTGSAQGEPLAHRIVLAAGAIRFEWNSVCLSSRGAPDHRGLDSLDSARVLIVLETAVAELMASEAPLPISYSTFLTQAGRPGSTLSAAFRALDHACFGLQLQDARSPCWVGWVRTALVLRLISAAASGSGDRPEPSAETLSELAWSDQGDMLETVRETLDRAVNHASESLA